MLSRFKRVSYICRRTFITSKQNKMKVVIAGASGGIGQPLSLLLKQCPFVEQLTLYGIQNAVGIATDLSHIETPCPVKGFYGPEKLQEALTGAHVILITAGAARKPGMTREDLFKINAAIVKKVTEAATENCPKALLAFITNPVNSVVPVASEVFKKAGKYDPKRIFGVTTLDVVRTNSFVAEAKKISPTDVNVPCIGGHSGITIIPVFSQATPAVNLSADEVKAMTLRVQDAGTEVVKAKAGKGSATLSMAYAAARFGVSLIRALKGEKNIIECAYVRSDVTEAKYFANPVLLGKNGVEKNLGIGKLNAFEQGLVEAAVPELKKNIEVGEKYVQESNSESEGDCPK